MIVMILGLVLFLAPHSVRIVADGWRSAQIARIGMPVWKGLYSLASIVGLLLVVWGYGQARATPVELWIPPVWSRHLASLFTLVAFVLLAATYAPRNRIRAAIGHPMTAGVAFWAFAHLMANGRLADLVLFGAFLVWAVASFLSGRRRDRAAGTTRPPGTLAGDALALAIGTVLWALFAFVLHGPLFGVRPFA